MAYSCVKHCIVIGLQGSPHFTIICKFSQLLLLLWFLMTLELSPLPHQIFFGLEIKIDPGMEGLYPLSFFILFCFVCQHLVSDCRVFFNVSINDDCTYKSLDEKILMSIIIYRK